MKRLFLTSSARKVIKNIAREIGTVKGMKLAFIYTPVEFKKGGINWQDEDRTSLTEVGFEVFDYTITGKSKEQIKKDIFDFVRSNRAMSLATASGKEPWVCTVFYGTDKDLNLYIVTDPGSEHGTAINKNDNVAFNIFDSHQIVTDQKRGVQGRGKCQKVNGLVNIIKGLRFWQKANPGAEKKVTMDTIKKFADTRIFKIVPSYLKFFNEKLYPDSKYGIWKK